MNNISIPSKKFISILNRIEHLEWTIENLKENNWPDSEISRNRVILHKLEVELELEEKEMLS